MKKWKEKSLQGLNQLVGVPSSKTEILYEHVYRSIEDLKEASKKDLLEIEGIGLPLSEIILEAVEENEGKE